MSRRRNRPTILLAAGALVAAAALAGCGNGDDTTTVEPSTTTSAASSDSTIVNSEAGIDAIVATWVQLGFSEDQARCLVDEMNKMSSQIGDTAGGSLSAQDQNLVDQMMQECGIEDEALKGQLDG